MPEQILVTGADGFIGRYLASALTEQGADVLGHSACNGDIATTSLSYDAGHVYHLAARSYVPDSWTATQDFYATNVLGTVNVLELCRRTGASLTLISSYVYGPPQFLPISEEHPLAAFNPYSHTKIMAEEAARYYARQFGLRVAIVRPFNIYGPGQRASFLIPTVVEQALSPDCSEIQVSDPRPKRDYLYVSDLISLLLAIRGREGVYNAGYGISASVAEVVEIVNSLIPKPKRLVSRDAERRAEVMDVVADIGKARRELAWEPRVSLREGLRKVLQPEHTTPIS
jgi:nucleoside-diphosphate-sugar epimerase